MGAKVWAATKRAAKAVGAGVAAGGTFLLGVWSESDSVGEAFASMSGVQWLGLTLSVLGAWGITYRLRNAPPK